MKRFISKDAINDGKMPQLKIDAVGLTEEEEMMIKETVTRMNRKRRRSGRGRLLFEMNFQD